MYLPNEYDTFLLQNLLGVHVYCPLLDLPLVAMMGVDSFRFIDGTDSVHPLFGRDGACQGREHSHSYQALP
jgi:hypothetical protein